MKARALIRRATQSIKKAEKETDTHNEVWEKNVQKKVEQIFKE